MIRNNQSESFERMRYDRIVCSAPEISPNHIHRIGMDPIVRKKAGGTTPPPSRPPGDSRTPQKIGVVATPYHIYPSDHYGLVSDLL